MKIILAILAVFIFTNPQAVQAGNTLTVSSATQAGFDDLTETQKAAIIKDIVDKKELNKVTPDTPAIEKIDAWVDLGTKIGKGLSGAAKEAGVAVNDFAKTPVGVLTTALIVWKMIGGTACHFIGGLLIWIVGFFIVRSIFSRSCTKVTYDKEGVITGSERQTIDGEGFMTYCLMNSVVFVGGAVAIFTY